MTVNGNLSVITGTAYNWEVSPAARDLIDVNGLLSFGATATLNVSQFGSTPPSPGLYALLSYDGTAPVLPLWTINLPAGYASSGITTSANTVFINLTSTPEPASAAWLVLAASVGLARRRVTRQRA